MLRLLHMWRHTHAKNLPEKIKPARIWLKMVKPHLSLLSLSLSFVICLSLPPSSTLPTQLILGFTPDLEPPRPPAKIFLAARHFHSRQCVSKYNSECTKWKPDPNEEHQHMHAVFSSTHEKLPLTKLPLGVTIEFSHRNQMWGSFTKNYCFIVSVIHVLWEHNLWFIQVQYDAWTYLKLS